MNRIEMMFELEREEERQERLVSFDRAIGETRERLTTLQGETDWERRTFLSELDILQSLYRQRGQWLSQWS